MPRRSVSLQGHDAARFTAGMHRIGAELHLPGEFPAEVVAAAESAAHQPRLPAADRTDIPLVTIDPVGSRDLDQALHIARRGDGYRVSYAIADVAAFVVPDGPVDVEAHRRGQTLYAPDQRIPLHPHVLSEGAASLLPGEERPALLWSIDLDSSGEGTRVEVTRARVRSRVQLDYPSVQVQIDDGSAEESLLLLKEVGLLRTAREAERGGVSLPLPEQEVVVEDGRWRLEYRAPLPVEEWNAQISLLTGMGAAEIMLYGEVGLVRTLPAATHEAVAHLRRTAAALKLRWDAEMLYPDFVRSIDAGTPAGAAMLNACASLLRGAGYVAFDGGVPEQIEHAALASEYAHVTAPLRRLADRYAGEIAVALCADAEVPEWVRRRLRDLPKEMADSDRLAHRFEGAVVSLVEAAALADRVGETFVGVVTEVDHDNHSSGRVMLEDPAVEASLTSVGELPLGTEVQVRLVEANLETRTVRFQLD